MGLMAALFDVVFGGGRNAVAETVQLFRENAEKGAERDIARTKAALAQFAAEFEARRKSRFDRLIDGVNRLPRPAMALGTLALFGAAMVDPVWFAERMQGLALVPEPLWWLLGAVVSFYFGARHQAKTQDFQRALAETLARAPQVAEGIGALRALDAETDRLAGQGDPSRPETVSDAGAAGQGVADRPVEAAPNAALAEWRRTR